MSVMGKVARNTLFLSIAQILNPLTSILLVSTIARFQGAEGLGQYSLVLGIFYMTVDLVGLGLNIPTTRAVAVKKDRAAEFLVVTSSIGLVTSLLAVVVVKIVVFLLNYSLEIQAALNLLMWAVFPSIVIFFCEAIFLAFQKAHYIAGISIGENVCKVVIGLVLLIMGKGIFGLFLVILCLRLLTCVIYLISFWISIAPIVLKFDWSVLRELRHVSPVFTANRVLGAVLGRVDIILLSKLGTMTQVGYYSAALRLAQIAQILPDNLMRSVLPAMSEVAQMDKNRLKRISIRCTKYMAIYGVGASVGIYLLAGFLIRFFYSGKLIGAVTPLQILGFRIIFLSLTPIYASLLFATMYQVFDFFGQVVSTTCLAALCIFLVPRWGGMGASIAWLIASALLFLSLWAFIEVKIFKTNIFRQFKLPVLAGLLAVISSMVFTKSYAPFQAPVAFVTYLSLIITFEPEVRRDLFSYLRVLRNGIQIYKLH